MPISASIRLTLLMVVLAAAAAGAAQGRSAAFDVLPETVANGDGSNREPGHNRPAPGPEADLSGGSPHWQPEVIDTARDATYLSPNERQLVREINLLRADPPEYARHFLVPLRGLYHDNMLQYPGEITIVTDEGGGALEECIKALAAAKPAPPLAPRLGLSLAARDQVRDQGESGGLGHGGSDHSSPKTRINRYGRWETAIAENIDYGNVEARRIVTSLLIDDGVSSRGHRRNLLDPVYKLVGVAIGPHPSYRHMCVMDFAAGFQ